MVADATTDEQSGENLDKQMLDRWSCADDWDGGLFCLNP